MDLAVTLIRSMTRAFYSTDHVLVMDAIIRHSAITDEDLAYLLGMKKREVRMFASKLREDGLISVHGQQQQKERTTRSFTQAFYYVDIHYAVDAIKFKLKGMTKLVEERFGQKIEEKKAYHCDRCEAEYTEMEILDADMDINGWKCKRCGLTVRNIDPNAGGGATTHAGSEVQARLNKQLAPFEELMQKIDATEVPANDWDTAFAKIVPVRRDLATNPGAKTRNLDGPSLAKTVRGLKQEMHEDVVIEADLTPEERERREKERLRQKQEQQDKNALPVWHTASTVEGNASTDAANGGAKGEDGDEDAPSAAGTGASAAAATDEYFMQMQQESSSEDDDDSDDDDDDDDDGDDEDDGPGNQAEEDNEPSRKKIKADESSDDDE